MRALLLPIALILPLGACGGGDPIARMAARQATVDPPQLWSIEVTGPAARDGDKPILICTDRLIRTGFLNQHATTATDACRPEVAPVVRPGSVSMRCTMGGRSYAVYNAAKGDQSRDFEVRFSMRSLSGDDVNLVETRRFRLQGPCPPTWKVGDATDRYGRPAANAMR
jgi:hypothetical protein